MCPAAFVIDRVAVSGNTLGCIPSYSTGMSWNLGIGHGVGGGILTVKNVVVSRLSVIAVTPETYGYLTAYCAEEIGDRSNVNMIVFMKVKGAA